MSKSSGGIFQILRFRKLKLFYFTGLLILVSLLIFVLALKAYEPGAGGIAEKINSQCQQDALNRCFKSFFSSFAKEHEFAKTKAVLSELQKLNPSIRYCHSYAHAISIAEVEKNPENWIKVFSYVPDLECSYGFFHGVIEGKYRSEAEFMVSDQFIESVCLKELPVGKSVRSCAHAFGHVLLVQEEGVVEKAVSVCDKLPARLSEPCFQGVFMENIQKDNLSEHGLMKRGRWDEEFIKKETDLCNGFSGSKQTECWRSLAPAISSVFKGGSSAVMCLAAPTLLPRRACVREVTGEELVSKISSAGQPVDSCLFLEGDMVEYRNCIKDLISYTLLTSKAYKSEMLGYCSKVRNDAKEFCVGQVGNFN